jgi:hypothetical protein
LSVGGEKLTDRKVSDIGDGRQCSPQRRNSYIEGLHELAETYFQNFDVLCAPKIDVVVFGVGSDNVPAGPPV